MARGNRPVEVRVDDETRERWAAAARERGETLSTFVRETVDAAIAAPAVTQELLEMQKNDLAAARPVVPKADRIGGGCPRERHHRPGTYCKTCGAVPRG